MDQNQNELREKLNITVASGLVAKAVAAKTGIATDCLSQIGRAHV